MVPHRVLDRVLDQIHLFLTLHLQGRPPDECLVRFDTQVDQAVFQDVLALAEKAELFLGGGAGCEVDREDVFSTGGRLVPIMGVKVRHHGEELSKLRDGDRSCKGLLNAGLYLRKGDGRVFSLVAASFEEV